MPLTLVLASCSGGATPSTLAANPGPIVSKAAHVVPASLTFVIPRTPSSAAGKRRMPQYLPTTTASVKVTLVDVNGYAPSPTPSPTIVTVSGPACTVTSANYTCTVPLGLPIGSDVLLTQAYDATNAGGNLLSSQQSTFTIAAGSTNNLSMTLDASPGPIAVTPPNGTTCTGSPITSCTVSDTSALSFTLTVADAHGTLLANNAVPGSPVVSVTSSNTAIATVTAMQAPYAISLTPVAAGTASIAVTASPATGTSGLSATTLTFTVNVVATPQNIYVAVPVRSFSPNGAAGGAIQIFTSTGTVSPIANGSISPLNNPSGVAVDSAGNVYVANRYNDTVQIFTSAGAASPIAGGTITEPAGSHLQGVAVDGAGNIYVTLGATNTLRIYTNSTTAGGVASSIAGGSITGLDNPYGVAVDNAGNIYIANAGGGNRGGGSSQPDNGNIKIFTSAGSASSIAGGTISAGISIPQGIALDGAGNIYVANRNGNILIFTNSTTAGGVLSTTIGVGTTGTISIPSFGVPTGVAVDRAGNIYVAQNVNNSILIFTSAGTSATSIAGGAISIPGNASPAAVAVH